MVFNIQCLAPKPWTLTRKVVAFPSLGGRDEAIRRCPSCSRVSTMSVINVQKNKIGGMVYGTRNRLCSTTERKLWLDDSSSLQSPKSNSLVCQHSIRTFAQHCSVHYSLRHVKIGVRKMTDSNCRLSIRCTGDDKDDIATCKKCSVSPEHQGQFSFRRSSAPKEVRKYFIEGSTLPMSNKDGYTINVSKELMGVFRYIEKVKRAKLSELADTLRQVAGACLVFTCVRGILGPLVETFKTNPPSWSKLLLLLTSFDSFAVTYLIMKASEPLVQLSTLATENQADIMGGIEKEEEMMLAFAIELVKLFRRMRNIALTVAMAQFAQIVHSALKLTDPNFVASAQKILSTWLMAPWS